MPATLPFFPTSPCPLPLRREFMWGDDITFYDSGQHQGSTAWTRELRKWGITIGPEQDTTIDSLTAFVCDRRGRTRLFFFADPYDYIVDSGHIISATGTAATTLELLHPVCSYHVYPTSASIQTIVSALSGDLALGVHFTLDQDGGWIELLLTPNSSDYITTTGTTEYVRKARFARNYQDQSRLWSIFQTQVELVEHP